MNRVLVSDFGTIAWVQRLLFLLGFVLIFGSVWAGVGLLRTQNWARRFVIVFAGFGFLGSLVRTWQVLFDGDVLLLFTSLLGLSIMASVIWYLFRPRVRHAFGLQKPSHSGGCESR